MASGNGRPDTIMSAITEPRLKRRHLLFAFLVSTILAALTLHQFQPAFLEPILPELGLSTRLGNGIGMVITGSLYFLIALVITRRHDAGRADAPSGNALSMFRDLADISASNRLRESEARYRILANYAPDWEYWLGTDGRYVYVSPACEEICGHPPQAFLDDPELFCRLLDPGSRTTWLTHLEENRAAENGRHDLLVLKLASRAGATVWLEHQCVPVLDEQGRYHGRRGVNRDVTRRVLAEAETRHIARLLRTLSEANHTITRKQDEASLPGDICEIAVRLGGLTACQVMMEDGPSGPLLAYASAGVEVNLPERWLPDRNSAPGPGHERQPLGTPLRQETEDSSGPARAWRDWMDERGLGSLVHYPIQSDGRTVGLISFISDDPDFFRPDVCDLLHELAGDLSFALESHRHRRQEFEARFMLAERDAYLSSVLQTVPLGIGVLVGRVFGEVNPGLSRILGYSDRELLGQPVRMIYADDAEYERAGLDSDASLAADGRGSIQTRWRRKDGRIIDVQLSLSIFDSDPVGSSVVLAAEDITERRLAENGIRQARDMQRSVLDGMRAEVAVIDREGVIFDSNQAWREFSLDNSPHPGMPACHTEVGTNYLHICQTAEGKDAVGAIEMLQGIRDVLDGRLPCYTQEYPCHASDRRRWFIAQVSPLGVPPVGAVIVHNDITPLRELTNALRAERDRLATLTNAMPGVLVSLSLMTDGTFDIAFAGPGLADLFGLGQDKPVDARVLSTRIHPEDRPRVQAGVGLAASRRSPWSDEFRLADGSGGERWVEAHCLPAEEVEGQTLWHGHLLDISERKAAETKLRQAAQVFESAAEGVTITDTEGRILAVNASFTEITGYSREEVVGQNPRILKSGRHDETYYRNMWDSLRDAGHWRGEIWNRRKNGEIYPEWLTISAIRDELGHTTGYTALFTDITPLKRTQDALEYLAHHDPLTELPNRTLLHDRMEHALQRARRDGTQLAVLFLDLDRFKNVNDSLGHLVGDELLRAAAQRLAGQIRGADTLARVGGDEFIVLLEEETSAHSARTVAYKLLNQFETPMQVNGHQLTLTASIGISLFPQDGQNAETLLRHADVAMYKAKERGRNTYQFFDQAMSADAYERLLLENELRGAAVRGELRVHYQPQVDLASGELRGIEALVRWQHPRLGLIMPGRFIPLAEEAGIIGMVGEWVLRESCRQMTAWDARGMQVPRVAVNLSVQQIQRDTLLLLVSDALRDSGLDGERLELEVTESMFMREAAWAGDVLQALCDLGVKLAIDDFGTGYSSLGYLSRLPVHRLKIDQSFVRSLSKGEKGEGIVRAIIALGRSLGLETVAEGIEEQSQAAFLLSEACDIGQGYLFSHPLEADALFQAWSPGRLDRPC